MLRSKPSLGWNITKEAESLIPRADSEAERLDLGSTAGSVPGLRSALGQNLTSNPFKSFVSPCCLNSGEKPWVTPLDPVQSTGMVGDGYNSLPRNQGDLSLGRTSTFLRDHSVIRTNPWGTQTFLHLQKPLCSFNVTSKIVSLSIL